MIKVATSGHFDPLHRGHLELLRLSKNIGEGVFIPSLYVIIASDRQLIAKYGFVLTPLHERVERLWRKAPFITGVVVSVDSDDSVAETLKEIRPDIFTKGGDRTASNMNKIEIEACEDIGCKIIYGLGTKKAHSHLLRERIMRRYDKK